MLSLLCYVVAAVAFILAALSVKVGDLLLVDWGLFFVALGLLLTPLIAVAQSRRGP